MTRIKISAGILLSFVLLSIFTSVWVSRRCDAMLDCTRQIEDVFLSGDGSAEALAAGLEDSWNSFRKGASVILNNDKLSDPERLISRLVYLAQQDSPELRTVLEELRHLIKQLKHGETPALTSIL